MAPWADVGGQGHLGNQPKAETACGTTARKATMQVVDATTKSWPVLAHLQPNDANQPKSGQFCRILKPRLVNVDESIHQRPEENEAKCVLSDPPHQELNWRNKHILLGIESHRYE